MLNGSAKILGVAKNGNKDNGLWKIMTKTLILKSA